MASLNKVLLMGNLTRDPELRYTNSGIAVCDFCIACNRKFGNAANGDKPEVTYVDITVWEKQAESTGRYLQKGAPVFVEGRLQLDQWEDKETGKKRSRLRVVGERVQFLPSANRNNGNGENGYTPQNGSNQGGQNYESNQAYGGNQGFNGNQGYNGNQGFNGNNGNQGFNGNNDNQSQANNNQSNGFNSYQGNNSTPTTPSQVPPPPTIPTTPSVQESSPSVNESNTPNMSDQQNAQPANPFASSQNESQDDIPF